MLFSPVLLYINCICVSSVAVVYSCFLLIKEGDVAPCHHAALAKQSLSWVQQPTAVLLTNVS